MLERKEFFYIRIFYFTSLSYRYIYFLSRWNEIEKFLGKNKIDVRIISFKNFQNIYEYENT